MLYRRLRAVEDSEFGSLGLKFVGAHDHKMCNGRFTIQDGAILAHDILEHQQGTKKIGSIGDEMVALGGVCFVRAQWGELRRDRRGSASTPIENVAHDIMNMAGLFFNSNIPFRQKLVTSRRDDPTGIVDDVVECSREKWNKYTELETPVCAEVRDTYLEACRVYMLHGAKLAERRFGSGLLANNLFWGIDDAASDVIKRLDFEGQEFVLGYDFSGNVTFNEVYQEDGY